MPKIIWVVWFQGWDAAPDVAQAALRSWRDRNPGWTVQSLYMKSLSGFIPADELATIMGTKAPPEALSDLVRLALLHRYGGVWVDATTICARPLDEWLGHAVGTGFFAFDRPGPDRMIATWFLAAEKCSYVVESWRRSAAEYWRGRSSRDDYFWAHKLFGELYTTDDAFREIWDRTPRISARHPFHFGPNAQALLERPTVAHLDALRAPPVGVFKLTHKFEAEPPSSSLFATVCNFARLANPAVGRPSSKRILITWYGSFPGHGTVGDAKAMESAVSHLVGLGHEVSHATAFPWEIAGSRCVDWQRVDPGDYSGVVFVCGPVLANHRETAALFTKFAGSRLAAVSISLMPFGHSTHANPFDTVFARQGSSPYFGDIAIAAPSSVIQRPSRSFVRVGLSLRGPQGEYGTDRCMSREAEVAANYVASEALKGQQGEVVMLENHLARSRMEPDEIEARYAECSLVVTSRFHGAVMAMRAGVPFIAIDQIRGGAKVHTLLSSLGWPHVYKIDELDEVSTARSARELVTDPDRLRLERVRGRAVADANKTLRGLDAWVASI